MKMPKLKDIVDFTLKLNEYFFLKRKKLDFSVNRIKIIDNIFFDSLEKFFNGKKFEKLKIEISDCSLNENFFDYFIRVLEKSESINHFKLNASK